MAKNCKPNIIIPDKYSVVVVQNITERNNISCKLRQNGMIAIVVEEGYAQYQIQTKEGIYSVCNNNAWTQIETGDKVFDGNNLIILNDETHKQEYLQSGLAVKGQMIFFVPEQKYYTYNGIGLGDPFPNKLDKPLGSTMNPDNKLIPVYGASGDNPEWLPSNTLGKVESVNGVTPIPGTKNINLNLSDIPDNVGYATDAELTQLSGALDAAIATKLDKTSTTVAAPDAIFKYVYLTDETNNVRRMLAGDLGKNTANSSLTSVAGAGLKLGSSWTLDTNGQLYSITNLPDKSTDASFNGMIVQNSTGQVAWGNGKTLIKNMPALLSDAEKTNWKTEMNGGWTTNTMSVGVISPQIINKNNNYNAWIILKGVNLNLNPTSFTVEIMNEAGTTVLVTVPNSQVQLYQNGTDLIFYYNFSTLNLGNYKIRLWNGVAYYTTSIFIKVVNNVINFDLSNLTWQTKIYNDLVPKNISISPNNVSMASDLKNTDNSEFNEAQISTGTVIGTIQSNAVIDINGVPITWADDFYINFDLNCQNYARAGAGITNNNIATLTPAVILGMWTDDGSWQAGDTTAGNNSGRPSNTYGFSLTIIKRGSIATILLQGETKTTIGSVSTITTSENVYFKFFKYINRAPGTVLGDTNGMMIKEAYKF